VRTHRHALNNRNARGSFAYLCPPQRVKQQHKTLKKTRRYIIDGVEVTSTTSKVVDDLDLDNQKEKRVLR